MLCSYSYFIPISFELKPISYGYRSFFRYFWVDLEKKCPFWDEEGKCFMEACSVCACDENELPFEWAKPASDHTVSEQSEIDFGWITSESNMDPLQNLEEVKLGDDGKRGNLCRIR